MHITNQTRQTTLATTARRARGFRSRLIVLINWTINYFNYERGVRLITSRAWRLTAQGEPVSRRAR